MGSRALDLGRRGFSIVPGPRAGVTGMSSVGLREIEEIEPGRVVATLLALPAVRKLNEAPAATWAWRAEFQSTQSRLQLKMTLLEPSDGRSLWGGFELEGVVTVRDLATIAQHLQRGHRGVWIHDGDSRLYDPDDFETNVTV